MTNLADVIYRAGRDTPDDEFIDPSTLLPCAKSFSKGITKLYDLKIANFRQFFLRPLVDFGGALTTDGVTLKVQDRQFYD